jgi:hypothetical protein
MSLKFIRQQTISSIIRLRSNSKRTDLTLFCEQDENASMPVVTLMASRCYARHERVHRHSPTGGAACPSRLSVPSCSRPYKTKPSVALNRGRS